MLFNSIQFIFVFFPITFLLFFCLVRLGYYQSGIVILVAASFLFYGWWNPAYLGLLIFSIIFNYFIGSALSQRFKLPINRKLLLILGTLVNLALIGYFKYANFFVDIVNDITGISFTFQKIILPLGISFFTFQQITYLVDAYRGETKEYNFINYCLFVSFFPQLIAGPIVHHKELLPQFNSKNIYKLNPENIAIGLTIFVLGLCKKVLIADNIAGYATPVFQAAAEGNSLTFYDAWSGALFYSFQLYFDFSGYSEMAIGTARMLGIILPLNFYSPYQAVNITEFWRRWHITLSNFLRDYLYIPLGGNRQGKIRRYLNLMITMLLGGLWHGAGWTFVIWGGLHGLYLIVNNLWRELRRFLGNDLTKIHWLNRILACIVTFIAVVFAWVIFRAENFESAILIWQTMIGKYGISLSYHVVPPQKKLLIALCLFVWFVPNTIKWMNKYNPALHLPREKNDTIIWTKLQWQPQKKIGIIIGILIFIVIKILLDAPESEFLYFDF